MSAMKVTSEGKVLEEMWNTVQRDTAKSMQFIDKAYMPMISIFINTPSKIWFTRQAIIDILGEQWQVGNNEWNTGWSQDHGIDDWLKEKLIGTMLMGEAIQKKQGYTNLVLRPSRDARLISNTVFESDNDIKSIEQFRSMRQSNNPLELIRTDSLIKELMYIVQNKLHQSLGDDHKKRVEKLSKLTKSTPIRKRNWFGFGNRETVSFPGVIELELFDPSISITEQIGVYSLNRDSPRMQQSLGETEKIDNESNDSLQPAFSK